jgi:hypothetical protein
MFGWSNMYSSRSRSSALPYCSNLTLYQRMTNEHHSLSVDWPHGSMPFHAASPSMCSQAAWARLMTATRVW